MDYKKLIYSTRDYAEQYKSGSALGRAIVGTEDVMFDAADAIEALLAERDAAIRDIWLFSTGNHCRSCVHWENGRCSREGPKDCAGYSWWQWRGPQKEGCV